MRNSFGSLTLGVFNALVYAFLLLPVLVTIAVAFNPTSSMTFPPSSLSLRWFNAALNNMPMINSLYTSVVLALIASAISLGLGMLAAFAIVRYRFAGKELVQMALVSPMIVPAIVIGISLLQYFTIIGLGDSFQRLVLGHILIALPYTVRSVSASLYGFDRSLEQASLVMGASYPKTLYRIVVPMIKPGVIAATLFAFITSFDNVVVSMFLIGPKTMTLPVSIMMYMEWKFDPSVAAISTLLILMTAVIVIAAERVTGLGKTRI